MDEATNSSEIRVSPKRYFILFIFCLLSATNSFQWIMYSIIADTVRDYYEVPPIAIDSTSVIYMIVYIPLIFPSTFLLTKYGLRVTLLVGSFGNFIGSVIRCFSVSPTLFYVTLIGQTISGISQVFILNIPPHLSSIWFPNQEISTATAIGVFGNQLGIAAGFVVPTYLVTKSALKSVVGSKLGILYEGTAIITFISFVLILFFFDEKPKYPPSIAAKKGSGSSRNNSYSASLKSLFTDKPFMCLVISFGLESGVLYAISTLLNQIIGSSFPGKEQAAGDMGLIATVSGIFGATIAGVLLDKSHFYHLVTLVTYLCCILATAALVGFIQLSPTIWPMYLGAGIFGFFLTGYLPVGYEFAAEITFPEPEGTSAGLLNASAQIFGVLMTYSAGIVLDSLGINWMLIFASIALVIGLICMFLTKFKLKRLEAERDGLQDEQPNQIPDQAVINYVY